MLPSPLLRNSKKVTLVNFTTLFYILFDTLFWKMSIILPNEIAMYAILSNTEDKLSHV